MVNYYPEELTVTQLRRETGWRIDDQAELQRLQDVEDKKQRGKGTPKKAKSKGTCQPALPDDVALTPASTGDSRRTSRRR